MFPKFANVRDVPWCAYLDVAELPEIGDVPDVREVLNVPEVPDIREVPDVREGARPGALRLLAVLGLAAASLTIP